LKKRRLVKVVSIEDIFGGFCFVHHHDSQSSCLVTRIANERGPNYYPNDHNEKQFFIQSEAQSFIEVFLDCNSNQND
jgi:hypothetical protein